MKRIFDPALLDFYLQKHEIPSLFDTPDLAFSLYQFEKGERLDTLNPEEYLSFLVDGSIEISANRSLRLRFPGDHARRNFLPQAGVGDHERGI